MSIKVKAVERNVSFDKTKEKWAYVMQPELYGKLTQSKVINEASLRSGISRGAINAAWDAIGEVIKAWATEGHAVAIPGLGTMRFGLRAASVGDVNKVGSSLITSRRVIFTPNTDIKEELARTSINITCYDRNGNIVKRVTSSDEGDVEDPDGNVVLENEAKSSVAMKDTTAALMNSLLQEVVNGGTGYEGRISGMHVAGKTGTTNNDQDRYFVGYTPYYSCAVWVGYVHNQRIVASGNPAASMWQKVMSRVHEGLEDKDFFSCSGLTYVSVCADSGLLATENCALDCRGSRVYSALVAADNAPSASCNLHTSPDYTVAFVDENGETTMASGSILNYERQRLPGYEDLEAEDDFMLLYGGTSGGDDDWDGFFGGSDDDEDDDDVHTSWWG